MTIRTFWTILIKLLGIWILSGGVSVISQIITLLPYLNSILASEDQLVFIILTIFVIVVTFYFLLLSLFLFKSTWLIDTLHLEKGFEENTIQFELKLNTTLSIAVIILGGIMFVDALIEFCQKLFVFLQDEALFRNSSTSPWLVFYFFKTIFGYLLLTNSKTVVSYVIRNSDSSDEDNRNDIL